MKQKQRITFFCMAAVALILAACSSDSSTGSANGSGLGESSYLNPNITYGTLSDSRDGQIYYTVVIGTQTWMAENLNYAVDSSWCYNNSADSCAKYGRLYQWAAAMALPAAYNEAVWGGSDANHQGACPTGWHIPTNAEWITLINAVGGENAENNEAGTALKSTSGWYDDDGEDFVPGTDAYGFSALPAGCRFDDGYFCALGYDVAFWSVTELRSGYAYYWFLGYDNDGMYTDGDDEDVDTEDDDKSYAASVRCLKN